MRTIALLSCLAVLATSLPIAADPAPVPTDPHAAFDLASYRGQVVYLDFWASWCKPCAESLPWLNRLQDRYSDRGFCVVGVNLDRDRGAATKFLERHPVSFPVVYDPKGALAETWEIDAMPSSFLIDRDGTIRERHQGFHEADTVHVAAQIEDLLSKTAEPGS